MKPFYFSYSELIKYILIQSNRNYNVLGDFSIQIGEINESNVLSDG